MNKSRVEAFTDAIIAIILTIMVLEFKVPEGYKFSDMAHNLPYFFAYAVSFILIGVAWYNHHYMFALAGRITKKIYWANNIWLFTMSIMPIGTGWVGENLTRRDPELFYLIIFIIWNLSYFFLSKTIINELKMENNDNAFKIESMPNFRFLTSWKYIVYVVVALICTYIFPISGIILILLKWFFNGLFSNKNSDDLYKN